jgi:hypothetical protein
LFSGVLNGGGRPALVVNVNPCQADANEVWIGLDWSGGMEGLGDLSRNAPYITHTRPLPQTMHALEWAQTDASKIIFAAKGIHAWRILLQAPVGENTPGSMFLQRLGPTKSRG